MIILDTTSTKLQVVLAAAVATNQSRVFASYRDVTTTTFLGGTQTAATNSTTDVDFVSAPAASTQRMVEFITLQNLDTAPITATLKLDVSAAETILWTGLLGVGEEICYIASMGWQRLNSSGTPIQTGNTQNTNIQTFTSTGAGTWTKPTTFTPSLVRVVLYGAGGGGGGGASNTGLVIRTGGCGGGGGARTECIFLASDLSSTEPVSIGAGGTPGAGATAHPGAGAAGLVGGNSTFSSAANLITAFGGGGGQLGTTVAAGAGGAGGGRSAAGASGTASAALGGGPGAPATPNGGCGANSIASAATPVCAEQGGGAGGGHTNIPANAIGGSSLYGAAGGGVGAGVTVATALIDATAGGAHTVAGGGGGAAGTSGASPTVGTTGAAGSIYIGGSGGGGGGGSITANVAGKVGGDGGTHGGGGGGGGVGEGSGNGGTGGTGGNGVGYVITI